MRVLNKGASNLGLVPIKSTRSASSTDAIPEFSK